MFINNYSFVVKMLQTDLTTLIEQINRTAGFNLFHWATGRDDLNDYKIKDRDDNYFRASQGMRQLPTNLFNWDGHPLKTRTGFEIFDYIVPHTKPHYVGVVNYPFPSETKTRVVYDKSDLKKAKMSFPSMDYILEVPRKGPLGWIGLTKKVELQPIKTITQEKKQLLSEYVNTDCNEPAHLLVLSVPVCCPDPSGRGAWQSQVTIFTTTNIVSSIEEYIAQNPTKYPEFLRALFPVTKFPNVYNNILSNLYDYTEIRFVDGNLSHSFFEKNNRLTSDYGLIYEHPTRRVKVG
ncbi:hypothetical protein A2642_04125 [Candidatus Nomurabacteria bacterium RIFCSPHIGHO2_01_FULL_39_10]|uniref:Uncharacterized protein n=1 Tax=Candidatus Nomurabacteria bacterium RIFCSPHIGHO2_01_FULL_39_10 TaxID=1801733 RepID=A0A1F6V7H9_9BACT|nr:MAG: hypothetical protein A2642_04125 [Candidatus Nomurabacteria bacterium RIFCSPHIGHO2_01_FULL_39_10]